MGSYRTFFTVRVDAAALTAAVDARASYLDIQEGLVVEQVAARLDGRMLGVTDLATAFPEALRAAQCHADMKRRAAKDATLRGPFNLRTTGDAEPSDATLLAWFVSKPLFDIYRKPQAPEEDQAQGAQPKAGSPAGKDAGVGRRPVSRRTGSRETGRLPR